MTSNMRRRRNICVACVLCIVCLGCIGLFSVQPRGVTPIYNKKSIVNVLSAIPSSIPETHVESRHIHHYPIANNSKTKPPFYPLNGTGQTVDISGDFNIDIFNDFCAVEKDLAAIVPVYSAPGNFNRRKAMRETVGRMCTTRKCKMFFIVGVSLDKDIFGQMKEEYLDARDMLVIDKVDTYKDLNNKVVAMLDWLIQYCPKPKYVIHMIDDFFPNIDLILGALNSIKSTRFILGKINGNLVKPKRKPDTKWEITEDEYPYPNYPRYIFGVVYAFLNEDTAVLREWVHAVEYCWVEDVWFTGHVRKGAGFEHNYFLRNIHK